MSQQFHEGGYVHRHPVDQNEIPSTVTSGDYVLTAEQLREVLGEIWTPERVREFIKNTHTELSSEEIAQWTAFRIFLENDEDDPLETR